MALTRTQYEYLAEDASEPVIVIVKPVDRVTVYRQLEAKDLPEDVSIGEFNRRLVHAALVRMGTVHADYEEWFATLDAFGEVEPDSGEAGATPATS
jgi:hypothetical protein